MKDRLRAAIQSSPADFTEVRVERSWSSTIAFRGRRLEGAAVSTDEGGCVRCLNRSGGWGVASFTSLRDLERMVRRAHELSLAVRPDTPLVLAPVPVREADLVADLDGDVRGVALADKTAYVGRLNASMLERDRRIVDCQTAYRDEVTEYWMANSDGALVYELRPEFTLSALAVAREEGTEERSVASIGRRKGWRSAQGREDLFLEAADRALTLLRAAPVRDGRYPVVLDPRLAGVFIHETLGHLLEADALPADPRLRSALAPGARIAGDLLTIGDDGSAPGLRATRAFDDEGAPTQNTLLVQHGVVVGYLHSRETAGRDGVAATGNGRALSYRHPPIVRMSNTYVAAGEGTLDDLLDGIALGVYASDAAAGRTHDENFMFTAGLGRMIRHGELAEPVKGVVLSGSLFPALTAIDGIAGDFQWNEMGGGCGKAGQSPLPVSEGAPHIRLSGIIVGGPGSGGAPQGGATPGSEAAL